jgi:uncharacterized protein with FMN-binding domain
VPTRATAAIAVTIVALVLLFSFKTPEPTRPRAAGAGAALSTPAAGGSLASSQGSPSDSAPAPPATSNNAAGRKDGQFTGQDILTRWGDVQVKVTISGGRITDVQALQLPYDRQRSSEISQYAGPQLHDEVLQAQSAQIDTISGATYTSAGYAQSVQSALDQAHA